VEENIVDDLRVNGIQVLHAFDKIADRFVDVIVL